MWQTSLLVYHQTLHSTTFTSVLTALKSTAGGFMSLLMGCMTSLCDSELGLPPSVIFTLALASLTVLLLLVCLKHGYLMAIFFSTLVYYNAKQLNM